jgi:tetratricopeptide (TPR) repeat protein
MRKYLEEYPLGNFLTQAHFYLADCSMKEQDYTTALNSYSYVVRQPASDFTEAAWSGAARANYNLKNYADAAAAFEQVKSLTQTPMGKLDAELGCMRSYVAIDNNEKAAASANVIVASTGISPELKREANLIIGRASQQSGDHNKAVKIFKSLVADLSQPVDAEAQYRLIASYFALKKYKETEDEVIAFSESKSRQLYWMAKSFIILGDIYVQKNNKAQAKATYESVVNGYTRQDDGVIDEAKQKLSELE